MDMVSFAEPSVSDNMDMISTDESKISVAEPRISEDMPMISTDEPKISVSEQSVNDDMDMNQYRGPNDRHPSGHQ